MADLKAFADQLVNLTVKEVSELADILKDEYGIYYTHGWLPIDEKTGQIHFTYKGVMYEGGQIWKGMDVIQNDIRNPKHSLKTCKKHSLW